MDRKKVAIIDDNPVNLDLARNSLEHQYDVYTIMEARTLFALLEKVLPDIILLDVMMPGMNGYEVIKTLKNTERTADIPVVFITSKSDTESEIEGLKHGAADYISKPFSVPILQKRVELVLLIESQKKELQKMNIELKDNVAEKTTEILGLQNAVLKTMGNLIEYRDDITGSHIERTESLLSVLVDEMIYDDVYRTEIEQWDLDLLLNSAWLHDVGKIITHDNILMKPGPLTADEYTEMKKHAIIGEKIIEKIIEHTTDNNFLNYAKIMAGTHHEKWDGTGYPRKIAGFTIPLQGRLMAIVDVFDALISERPYKKPFPVDKAIQEIQENKGIGFEPVIADVFIKAVSRLL